MLSTNSAYINKAIAGELAELEAAQSGARNNTLFKVAARLYDFCKAGLLSEAYIEQELSSRAGRLGLTPSEVQATLRSAYQHATPANIPNGVVGGTSNNSSKSVEDPQTYPDRHGCTWADFAKFGAKQEVWLDYRKNVATSGQTFDAIFFPDATGGRYRLFNHPDSKFIPAQPKQGPVLYGLQEAVALASSSGQDTLYLVNGQPSVIACQAHGVPAFTVPGGEGGIAGHLEKVLFPTLLAFWAGKLRIVLDGDSTGYKSAPKVVDVLRGLGHPDVAALDPGQGFDAADLCVLNNGTSVIAFQNLPVRYPHPAQTR
jgi:hypothetical protein